MFKRFQPGPLKGWTLVSQILEPRLNQEYCPDGGGELGDHQVHEPNPHSPVTESSGALYVWIWTYIIKLVLKPCGCSL